MTIYTCNQPTYKCTRAGRKICPNYENYLGNGYNYMENNAEKLHCHFVDWLEYNGVHTNN